MIRRLAPLFSLALVLSCGSPTATTDRFAFDEPFWIRVGETAVSADGGTVVQFVSVLTDSRCPPTVVCVWAGEALVELKVFAALGLSFDPAAAAVRSATGAGAGAGADGGPSHLSIAPPPSYEVRVGASEPLVADGRRIEALALTRQGPDAGTGGPRRAQLRIALVP